MGFKYPAFLVKSRKQVRISCLKWVTGYLIAGAILVIIEAAAGHNRLTGWSYIIFSYMFAWITVSIIGLIKGWFY